jgi:hypothetical protein
MAAGAAFTNAFGEATEEQYDSGDVALLAAAAADRCASMRTTLLQVHSVSSARCVRLGGGLMAWNGLLSAQRVRPRSG